MGHVKEPKGIDLIVSPEPLSAEERKRLSEIIAKYRTTGRKPKAIKDAVKNKKPVTRQAKVRNGDDS